ncbi:hypothetical protein FKM82_028648 [Ascaphus truei]
MCGLEGRKERGIFQKLPYIKGFNQVQERSMFQRERRARTRGHSLQPEGGMRRGNVRKYFIMERVVDSWNRLPAEVVGANTVRE